MSKLLLLAWLMATPGVDLYPRVQALAKSPSPAAIHRLIIEAVDAQTLVDRILVDAKDLDPAERQRLGSALQKSLELRAAKRLGESAFTCDRSTAVDSHDPAGAHTLRLACTRGEGRGTIELWISANGRIYDAALDGALLSRNLRAQINKGLRVNGLEEVIRRLESP